MYLGKHGVFDVGVGWCSCVCMHLRFQCAASHEAFLTFGCGCLVPNKCIGGSGALTNATASSSCTPRLGHPAGCGLSWHHAVLGNFPFPSLQRAALLPRTAFAVTVVCLPRHCGTASCNDPSGVISDRSVPNTCIGGSGARTCDLDLPILCQRDRVSVLPRLAAAAGTVTRTRHGRHFVIDSARLLFHSYLGYCAACLAAFGRTLSLCWLGYLLWMLSRTFFGRTLVTRQVRSGSPGRSPPFLAALSVVAAVGCDRPLVWTCDKPPTRRPKPNCRPALRPVWLSAVFRFLLCYTLPVQVWAAPGADDGGALFTHLLRDVGSGGVDAPNHAVAVDVHDTMPTVSLCTDHAADPANTLLHCLVFAAGYRTEHLLLHVPHDTCESGLVAHASAASALVQRLSPAQLFPVRPQPGQGYANFIIVPDWIPEARRQTVLLDFSRLRGPTFAHVFHNPLTYRALEAVAETQTDELWHAFVPDAFEPLEVGGEVRLAEGALVSFSPRDVPFARDSDLSVLLDRPSTWQSEPEQVLLERPTVQHVSFGHPTEPLNDVVHLGKLYDKLAAADYRAEHLPPGPNLGSFVFVDARQSARGLGFLFEGEGSTVPTQDGVRVLGLQPPRGFRTFAEHPLLQREGLPVVDGRVLVLGYERDESSGTDDVALSVEASPAPDDALVPASPPAPTSTDGPSPLPGPVLAAKRRAVLDTKYEHLVVVQPQPDRRFCTFIALPLWATQAVCVVVDARAVDGRLFAACFESGLYPRSVLVQISLRPSIGFQVMHNRHVYRAQEALVLAKGDVLFILPAQAALPRTRLLPDMLRQSSDWHVPVPDFHGFLQTPYYLLTDAWNTIADFPASASTSYAALRQFAVAFLRYEDYRTSLQTLHPRIADYNFHGISCRAIFIATERPIGSPAPPARPRPLLVAYAVDRRAVLADITWHVTLHGRVDLDMLMAEFEPAPSGFFTSITGGMPERDGDRTFLRVDHGQVLAVVYEEDMLEADEDAEQHTSDGDPDNTDASSSTSSAPPAAPKPAPAPVPGARNRKRRLADGPSGAPVVHGHRLAVNVVVGCVLSTQLAATEAVPLQPTCSIPVVTVGSSCSTAVVAAFLVSFLGALPLWASAAWATLRLLGTKWKALAGTISGFVCRVALLLYPRPSAEIQSRPSALSSPLLHGSRQAKLLLEPRADSGPERLALATLRYFAPRLGEAWRYLPAEDAEFIPTSSGSEDQDDIDLADHLTLFVLLAPGYAPEQVAVMLRFPSTLVEAMDTVQLARNTVHSPWFHVLAPVEPQPQPGIGVAIALADWQRQEQLVCLDCTRLDGRRFAIAAPSYADRLALLHLADIQLNLGVDVYVGDDPQPLAADVQVHMWTGLAIFFMPPERAPPRPFSLAWTLTDWRMWRRSPPETPPAGPDAYILVYQDETILHLTDPRRPTRHRNQIAAALGIALSSLQLLPAVPRVTDATLNGLVCRTILAVCDRSEQGSMPWCAVLLDLRALGRGWKAVTAVRHQLSCDTLREELDQDSPDGWPDGLDVIDVHPGQVLVAYLRPGRLAVPAAAAPRALATGPAIPILAPAPAATADDAAPLTHPTGPPRSFGPPSQPTDRAVPAGPGTDPASDISVEDDSTTALTTSVQADYLPGTFLVLAQDYCPELVHARLPVGCTDSHALEQVGAARAPFSRLCTPRLVVAYPQTVAGVALMLALPFWTPDGATIACDLTRLTGVVFSLQLPSIVRREDLLRALGVDIDAPVDLYLRDLPWPLPRGAVYDLRTGDTVVVTPVAQAAHAPIPTGPLSALLATVDAWNPDWAPDAAYRDTVWLLTETGDFMFTVASGRRAFFRNDIAALLQVRADRLLLAAPDPAIQDHAAKGVLSLNVIAVLGDEPPEVTSRQGGALCFLDCRPVMCGISRLSVTDGVLDTARLTRRFAQRCPQGYQLCRLSPHYGPCSLAASLPIRPGEVIVLAFMPGETVLVDLPSMPPDDGTGADPGPATGDPITGPPAHHEAIASAPVTGDASSRGSGDAGTGGTQRAGHCNVSQCSPAPITAPAPLRELGVSRVVKWRQACFIYGLACTSILLHCALGALPGIVGRLCASAIITSLTALLPACTACAALHRRGARRPPLMLFLVLLVVALPVATAASVGDTPRGSGLPICSAGVACALQRLARPVATPCRARGAAMHISHTADSTDDTCSASPTRVGRRIAPTNIAPTGPFVRAGVTLTEAPSLVNPAIPKRILRPGFACGMPTLLDHAAALDDAWASRASVLIEGLVARGAARTGARALSTDAKPVTARPAASVPVLQLADTVPLTRYQSSCLELQNLVPVACTVPCTDWLDNDLRFLRDAPDTLAGVSAAIPDFAYWHTISEHGGQAPACVHVYTDGSAHGTCEPLASAPCGWAFNVWIETVSGWYFYGYAASTAVAPYTRFFLGESDDSPLTSELLGTTWALAWILEYGPMFDCPVHLHYDCTAAGEGTFAQAAPAYTTGVPGGPCLSHVAVAFRQIAAARVSLTSDYIPGHQGLLGNELSDSLAKHVRTQAIPIDERVLPEWPARLACHDLLEWAWLVHTAETDLPTLFAFESEAGRLQNMSPLPRPPPQCGIGQPAEKHPQPVHYHIKAVTFNILTLLESAHAKRRAPAPTGLRMMGRRHVILRQLRSEKVLFAGLQETRVQDTALLPDRTHILLHSGANDAGNYGCALWVSKSVPYAHVDGQPLCLEPKHCTVSAASPRHLVVCVEAPHLRLGVIVVHAPSDPQDEQGVLHAFWAARTLELDRLPKGMPVLVLADANSRLGSLESEAVGSHHAETETPAAAHFHSFLLRNGLWLPATFAGTHTGPSWTWQSPRGDQHRIDYVCLPQAWTSFACSSRVWHTFEALQQRCDHLPVTLECTFVRESRSHITNSFRRVACRPNDLDPSIDKQAFCRALLEAPPVDWNLDVDGHFGTFVTTWTAAGRSIQPKTTARPQQSFLSAHALGLIRQRKDTRIALRAAEKELHRRLLIIGFAAFTHSRAQTWLTALDVLATWRWVRQACRDLAVTWSQLNQLCTSVRQAVKADRCRYLQRLADDVQHADLRDPRHLYQCVRRAFPKAASAKRSRFTPLPAVTLANGMLAATGAERAARWNSHFAAQECGTLVTPTAYCEQLTAATAVPPPSQPPVFDPRLLPSLDELERSVLQLKRGKAAGPDGVTSELLKLAVPTAARHLLPLFVKSLLTLREPVEFKGGALMTLAKKASAAFECDRYRSILLSSVPGKLLHKSLRKRIAPLLQHAGHDLMGGVHPGVGVDSISTAVRSYQAHAQATGGHPAVIFFDVRAAYYQVVRETLTGAAPDDSVLRSLFCKLGVPATALAELRDHLTNLNHIIDSGGSQHLEAFTRELFRGTWFRLDQHIELVATAAGVRPGDPLADVFFALSFSAYIQSVQTSLQRQDLVTTLPPCATCLPVDGHTEPRTLPPASWADDFAAMLSADSPAQTVSKVRDTTSAFLTHATSIGMQLSFAVDKTAALLPPAVLFAGVCEPAPRDSPYEYFIPVRDDITGQEVRLPAVQAYKHLGGIVTCSASLLPEVYYRFSQCTWTLRPLRGSLFGNPSIPLPLRRTLLGSLVATKFTFGSATMELHVAYQWRLWARLYTSIWKALLPRSSAVSKIHSYEILRQAQALAPPLALAKARASLYLRVLEHGPATLLHLWWLQWESAPGRSWLAMLLGDLEYVALYCPAVRLVLDSPIPLVALTEALLQDRTWWRRQINAATRIYFADLERWAHQRIEQAVGPTPAPSQAAQAYSCPFCTASFPLKKHLSVHIARRHGLPAPKRLFAPHATCLACLKHFHSIPRAQNHLKSVPRCLERVHLLMPPMELSEVKAIEQADRAYQKRIRSGCWQAFDANRPVLQAYGPPQPTRAELLSALGEEAPISLLVQPPPNPAFTAWVCNSLHARTCEPPRAGTRSFWWRRIQ
ncbi:CFDP2 [Symbiodinium sp. CCMP2592]|nr:CFDP2 [Symbiodinium sp. CCMP2592]